MVEKSHGPGWMPDFFEPFRHVGQHIADWFTPRSDAVAAESTYRIGLELPGVKQSDIDIELHDGVLTVKGEKRAERTEEKAGYFFTERQYGRFQRSFRLPADAAAEGISARFDDGVLTITVPQRTPDAPQAQKIQIG
ncbi:MAG: Hsp20/alpha crystallin family protein [Pikeienuella sp.]